MVDNEISDKVIEYETERFMSGIIPFGSRDIDAMIRTALDAGRDGDWCAEQINDYIDDCGIKLDANIDPMAVVYGSLLQEARNDIDNLTGKDILNDTDHQVEVCGNFMCTSIEYSEEAKAELLEILKEIAEEDETDAIKWLIDEIDIRVELKEKRKEYAEENAEEEEPKNVN